MSNITIERDVPEPTPPLGVKRVTVERYGGAWDDLHRRHLAGELEFYRDDSPNYVGVRVPGYDGTWVSLSLTEVNDLIQGLIEILTQKKGVLARAQ
jgi:hypothetical protein